MNGNELAPGAPIDHAYLASISGEDEEFERELVESYLGASVDVLIRLRDSVARADAPEIRNAVHALKGSSLAIGAKDLGMVCEELEQRARAGDLGESGELLAGIQRGYDNVAEYIRQTWAIAA